MDEPVRSRLRPARRRGLTRPDPVTALPWPQRPPASTFPSRKTRTSRRRRQRPGSHSRKPSRSFIRPPAHQDEQQNLRGGSRLRPCLRTVATRHTATCRSHRYPRPPFEELHGVTARLGQMRNPPHISMLLCLSSLSFEAALGGSWSSPLIWPRPAGGIAAGQKLAAGLLLAGPGAGGSGGMLLSAWRSAWLSWSVAAPRAAMRAGRL